MSIEFIAWSCEKWLVSYFHRREVEEKSSYSLLRKNRKYAQKIRNN